jgi:hypothetical protein
MVTKSHCLLLVTRVAVTLTAWLVLIIYAHHYIHVFEVEIVRTLHSPLLQIAAAIIALTVLLYLIIVNLPFKSIPGWHGITVLLFWMALVVLGHALTHLGVADAKVFMGELRNTVGIFGMLLFALGYAIALATPFVAGVEIGLLIMAVFGTKGVLIAYGGTLAGLSMAFAAGRLLSPEFVQALLRRLGVDHNIRTLDDALDSAVNGNTGGGRVWRALAPLVLKYRYVTLAVLLNCPANAVIGGGGGLALLTGISRDVTWRRFLLTIAIATSPVPILVLLGLMNVDPLLQHHGFVHDLLTALRRLLP